MEWNLIQCERDLTQLFWIMNWESSHLWISLCIFFTVQLEIYKINIKFIHSAKKIMFLNLYNIWCEILLCERELLSIGRKIIIDGHFYREQLGNFYYMNMLFVLRQVKFYCIRYSSYSFIRRMPIEKLKMNRKM